jgi:hypothetical protein
LKFYLTPVRMNVAKEKKSIAGEGVGEKKSLYTFGV